MAGHIYRFGDFSMAQDERLLFHHEQSVPLAPKTFDALLLLVKKQGSLVGRDEIIRTLWPGIHVSEANLTNIIVLLRKALGKDAIETVSKFGYRLTLRVSGGQEMTHAAYESFVRGKELVADRSIDGVQRGRDLFLLCVTTDPQFGDAWAWLGRSCHLLYKLKHWEPVYLQLAEAAFRRAFFIDPDLASAHQFYTRVQVDSGRSLDAMTRLVQRATKEPEEAETFAGMVQVLRCCGLLRESVAAHKRAVSLDPTIKTTSVEHTLFLQGAYADVFEHYTGKLGYLDVASWAALGHTERAVKLMRARLGQPGVATLTLGMIRSLLAVLEGNREEALASMEREGTMHDPEGLFYYARHCGMVQAAAEALVMIKRAREGGFWSSEALRNDAAFDAVRNEIGFVEEIAVAQTLEAEARKELGVIFLKKLSKL